MRLAGRKVFTCPVEDGNNDEHKDRKMKVPLSWLRDYVDIRIPIDDLARKLTMAGHEVAEIIFTGGEWEHVVVGQITAINPHPNADRLRLATVDTGADLLQVVCGAPNLTVGDKIAFARVGAKMFNPHSGKREELKPAKIRGVESSGMICSEQELGISDNHEGILVLNPDLEVGKPLASQLGDVVFDFEITANRPDCLSVIGIAREVAALTGEKLHIPEVSYAETGIPITECASVEIADPDLCPRYCATLITGITIAESPAWLQERLTNAGQRPINNIVDISNYIMLEYGQPLHTFDYDRLAGHYIVARAAGDGEQFITLDDQDRELDGKMLVIGDGARTVAIAGVMGGLNSEVRESTTSILVEAASFKAASIHYTSHKLDLRSEAATRFERGISAEMTIPAIRHATQLIAELGGGTVAKGVIDVYPGKKEPKTISVTAEKAERVVGMPYTEQQMLDSLTALGFTCELKDGKVYATPPSWRSDINLDVDLIEEVARVVGYDKIPMTLLGEPIPHQNPDPLQALRKSVRHALTGYGFQEIYTYTLTSLETLQKLSPDGSAPKSPVRVVNPMTADQEFLRPNLRGGLLSTLASNRRYEEGGIKFYEHGKVFSGKENDLPAEGEWLAGIMSGPRAEQSWLGGDGTYDFYDVKGLVEGLLSHLKVEAYFEKSNDPGLHPARQAAVVIEGKDMTVKLGVIGEVHPAVADAFEVDGAVCLFELNIAALLPFTVGHKRYLAMPRFPGSIRDLALVVNADVTHRSIVEIINAFSLVSEIKLFDVYTGKQVGEGKKSLAYRLVYQSPTHTLTDKEVDKVQEQILKRLANELGAVLRG